MPICLVAGIASAFLSADLAWSHRVAVAATVAFSLAIALLHTRPDRTAWRLTGAFAVVVTVIGSRVDVFRGADPAWILWATALAVAASSARTLNASTRGGGTRHVMMTTLAALAATTALFCDWWYIAGSSLIVVATIGALPVGAVLFVGARASMAGSGSTMPIAVTSGVIGTALALLDPVPLIGQAAIAAVITGVVGVTMSTAESPLVTRFAKLLVLTSLVTAAGGSTWTVVIALGFGAFAVLRLETPRATAAHGRSLTARSAGPADLTVATDQFDRGGKPTIAPAVMKAEAAARPDSIAVSVVDHRPAGPSANSILRAAHPLIEDADRTSDPAPAMAPGIVVEVPAPGTAAEEASVNGPADQPDETLVGDDADGRSDAGSEPQADHANGVSTGGSNSGVEWPLDRVLARFLSPIDESEPSEDAPTGRTEMSTETPLRSRLHAALHQQGSSCADPTGPQDGSVEGNPLETETETGRFAFDLWSALGVDQVDGANEPDRVGQSVFSQRSKTSVFDKPEATPRSSS
ncbi:MAG: hypothetical protein ABIP17_08180 [Ilumatobacteraceae bacterium]